MYMNGKLCRIKFIAALSLLAILLCGCGSGNVKNESDIAESSVTASAVTTVSKDTKEDNYEQKFQTITAEAQGYDGEKLTFLYGGDTYTLPLSRDDFANDQVYYPGLKLYSEQIINNKLGEEVTAVLKVNEDMTKIIKCDVITKNGTVFTTGMGDSADESVDHTYTLKRTGGSMCEISNDDRVLEADLNDLIMSEKVDYEEEIADISFMGYLFTDGKFILNELYLKDGEEYSERLNREYPCFFGTVHAVGDDRAEIKLTDGETVCDVPMYYCDGELSEGLEVMVILDSSTDLFGSGKSESFDYAVICTDPAEYNASWRDFGKLAYARADGNNLGRFIYTEIE